MAALEWVQLGLHMRRLGHKKEGVACQQRFRRFPGEYPLASEQWKKVGRGEPASAGGPLLAETRPRHLSPSIHARRAQNSSLPLQLGKVWRGRLVRSAFLHVLLPTPFRLSRKYLTQLHSTPTDSNAADTLVTTYHTLLSATLSLWHPEHPISSSAFTVFVKSMLLGLPSSSQVASPPAATALGELLIDAVWSIDSQLDDVIADSKAAVAAQSEKGKENELANGQSDDSGALLSRDAAMKDKGTLLEVVKLLLVR